MSVFHSIKFRFTLWYLAILGILLVVLSAAVYARMSHTLHRNLDDSLHQRAAQLTRLRDVMFIVAEGGFEEEIGELVSFFFHADGRLMRVSARGRDVPAGAELIDRTLSGTSEFADAKLPTGENLRLYSVPFSPRRQRLRPSRFFRPGRSVREVRVDNAALVVARSATPIAATLERLLQTLLLAVPLTMLLALPFTQK